MMGLVEEPLLVPVEQERRRGPGQELSRPCGVECRRCRNVRWEPLGELLLLQAAAGRCRRRTWAAAAWAATQQGPVQQVTWPERLCGTSGRQQRGTPGVGRWLKAYAPVEEGYLWKKNRVMVEKAPSRG
jgi:hypothetical protein